MSKYDKQINVIQNQMNGVENRVDSAFTDIKAFMGLALEKLDAQGKELKDLRSDVNRLETKVDKITEYTKLGTEILINRFSKEIPQERLDEFNKNVAQCQKDIEELEKPVKWSKRRTLPIVKNLVQDRFNKVDLWQNIQNNVILESWLDLWIEHDCPLTKNDISIIQEFWLEEWGGVFPINMHTNRIEGLRTALARRVNETLRQLFNCQSLGDSEIPNFPSWHALFDLLVEFELTFNPNIDNAYLDSHHNTLSHDSVQLEREIELLSQPWLKRLERLEHACS